MGENKFNFNYTPGRTREFNREVINKHEPIVSIITAFYNGGKYLSQTANSILNQTFPYWEWIIVDDGSTNEESLKIIESIEKQDNRIHVIHKENGGVADTRDFGAKRCNKNSKYLMFLDEDDLIERTYIETAYWALETHPEASWAYTDVVNFDGMEYLWKKWFDTEHEKKENLLVVTALIKKDDFWRVNGYELREKAVSEDWNLWLKLLAIGKIPIRMNYYGFWYRRKSEEESELYRSSQNSKRALEIIKKTSQTIKKNVHAIQFPMYNYNWDLIPENVDSLLIPKYNLEPKIRILMITSWMVMGGADKFNLDLLKGLDKNKFEVIMVTTVPKENIWRQEFEEHVKAIYDLTTFLDQKYWPCFVNYLIESNDINIIFNTNSVFGYSILPYLKAKHPKIPIIDYIHMEEWYNRNGGYSRDSSVVSSVIDKTYVCNKNSQKILADHFKRNPDDLDTIYIGVDEEKFNPQNFNKIKLKEKYNIPTNKKVISFIARIDLQKRPHLLMKIINSLKQKRNDFVLIVAGDGPMLQDIKKEANKYKINENIIFLGAVSNTDEIYAISDLTLNCSIKEGLALTAYESLAMGIPVVSADVGGQKELITEETGVIVPCMQEETQIHDFKYSNEEIISYVIAIEKVFDKLQFYKSNCRNKILSGFTISQMKEKMSRIFEERVNNPNKAKIEQAALLLPNIDITKELITKQLMCLEEEYNWLVYDYNLKSFGGISKYTKIKDALYSNVFYRSTLKILKATGIIWLTKKIKLDKLIKKMIKKII